MNQSSYTTNPAFIVKPLTVSCLIAMTVGCSMIDDPSTNPNVDMISQALPNISAQPIRTALSTLTGTTTQLGNRLTQTQTQEANLSQQAGQGTTALQAKNQAQSLKQTAQQAQAQAQDVITQAQALLARANQTNNQSLIDEATQALAQANQALTEAQRLSQSLDNIIGTADSTLQAQAHAKEQERQRQEQEARQQEQEAIRTALSTLTGTTTQLGNRLTQTQTQEANLSQQAGQGTTALQAKNQAQSLKQTAQQAQAQAQDVITQAQALLARANQTNNQSLIDEATQALAQANQALTEAQRLSQSLDNIIGTADSTLQAQAHAKEQERQRQEQEARQQEQEAIRTALSTLTGTTTQLGNRLTQTQTQEANLSQQAGQGTTALQAKNQAQSLKQTAQQAQAQAQDVITQAQALLARANQTNNQSLIDEATQALAQANQALTEAQRLSQSLDNIIGTADSTLQAQAHAKEQERQRQEQEARQQEQEAIRTALSTLTGTTTQLGNRLTQTQTQEANLSQQAGQGTTALQAKNQAQSLKQTAQQAQAQAQDVITQAQALLARANQTNNQSLIDEATQALAQANQALTEAQRLSQSLDNIIGTADSTLQAQAHAKEQERQRQEQEARQQEQEAIRTALSTLTGTTTQLGNRLTQTQTQEANLSQQAGQGTTALQAKNQAQSLKQTAQQAQAQAQDVITQAQALLARANQTNNQSLIDEATQALAQANQALTEAQRLSQSLDNIIGTADSTLQAQAHAKEQERQRQEQEARQQEQEAIRTALSTLTGTTTQLGNRLTQTQTQEANLSQQAGQGTTALQAKNQAQSLKQTAQQAQAQAQDVITQAQALLARANQTNNQSLIDEATQALAQANQALTEAQRLSQSLDNIIGTADSTLQAQAHAKEQERQRQEQEARQQEQEAIRTALSTLTGTTTQLGNRLTQTQTQEANLSQQAGQGTTALQAKNQAQSLKQTAQQAQAQAQDVITQAQALLARANQTNNQSLIDEATQALAQANQALTEAQRLSQSLDNIIGTADSTLQAQAHAKEQERQRQEQERKKYVAPIDDDKVTPPSYGRTPHDKPQPTPHTETIVGYSSMDNDANSKLTEAFYGVSQSQYAEKLDQLKRTIDTSHLSVGVIDTGINPNNPDLVGATYHDKNLVACYLSKADCGDYYTFKEVGFNEFNPVDDALNPKGSHGSQMAAIIAGNQGMTNAKIYSYSDGARGHSLYDGSGDNFMAMGKLNQISDGAVKIFNNSWSFRYTNPSENEWLNQAKQYTPNNDTKNSQHPSVQAIHDLIINKDALLIHSTGNEGADNIYNEKLIPILNPDFKKGFLTVSSPREDFEKANLCGDSAEWCITSPSSSKSHNNAGELNTYAGTSPATARVTGTALLIKGAYPWMKNENIVQTLLSTAQDFDDIKKRNPTYRGYAPATDEEFKNYHGSHYYIINGDRYIPKDIPWLTRTTIQNIGGKNITKESGWGLLDTESATRGYGGFYWENIILDTTGTSVFSNNIQGNHGFTKAGEGKLVLTGENTYRGNTIVEGGVLEVNGNNTHSKIIVNNGELTGYGTVHDIEQTSGKVNNEGNLKVAGDYRMGEDAIFKAKFGNIMKVNGTASINGKLDLYDEITIQEPLIKATGSKSTVLRASTLEGQFKSYASSNPLFTVTNVEYTGTVDATGYVTGDSITDVVVSAKRNNLSSLDATKNTNTGHQTLEKNLDKVLVGLDAKADNNTLKAQEKEFAVSFANKIHHASTSDSTAVDNTRYSQTLFEYDPAFYINHAVHAIDQSAEQITHFAKQMNTKQNGVWIETNRQDRTLTLSDSTSERESYGHSIGVSTKGSVGVGLQLDIGKLSLDDSNGQTHSLDAKVAGLTLGASSALNQKTQLTAWIKGAILHNDASRNHQTSRRYDGALYAGGIHVGSHHTVNPNTIIKPYLGMGYYRYTHDGSMIDDGIHLVKDIHATRWQGTIGVDTSYQISPMWNIYASLQYDTAIKQNTNLNTQYVGTDTNLEFEAWKTAKDKLGTTLGTTYQIDPRNRIGLSYNRHQSEHSDGDHVQLTLSSQF